MKIRIALPICFLFLSLPASAAADPDLTVSAINVRDQARLGFITPTAGRGILVWTEIQNLSADAAPDVALLCRRSLTPEGTPLAQVSVRTGPIAGRARKTLSVVFPAVAEPAANHMWCIVDGGNFVRERNEANNTMSVPFTIDANRDADFAVGLGDFKAWNKEQYGHRRVPFQVANSTQRGLAIPRPPGAGPSARWQAACVVLQMPWVNVRETGNMTHYPSGELPDAGSVDPVSLWLFPVNLSGMPPASGMPATLSLQCEITSGLFFLGPVIHRGDDLPQPDWMPMQVWWSKSVVLNIPNPDSARYEPLQDVSITSVSGSSTKMSDRPPQSNRTSFARFSVRLVRPVTSLDVTCAAARPGTPTQTRTLTLRNPGTTASGFLDLGVLAEGNYSVRCEADPNRIVQDDDRTNNARSAAAMVYRPGVDLAMVSVEARDHSKLGFVTPTVGKEIAVWAEIKNVSGEDAPDVPVVCRRSLGPNSPPLAEVSARSGALASNQSKVMTLRMPAVAGPATNQLWCMVDGGNFLRETDENNNAVAESFTIERTQASDFSIELRDFEPWIEDPLSHRRMALEVVNVSARGAASPPTASGGRSLRWQAACSVLQMPWVSVREVGNMTHYPGGDLPAPDASRPVSFWLFPVDLYGMPPPSKLPRILNLSCEVRTGLFMMAPVLHVGDKVPFEDWLLVQTWWSRTVLLSIPNPDSRVPTTDAPLDPAVALNRQSAHTTNVTTSLTQSKAPHEGVRRRAAIGCHDDLRVDCFVP